MTDVLHLSEPTTMPVRALRPEQVSAALSDRNSRRVIAACVAAPRSVKEISFVTRIPLATAYRQVHRLSDLGILVVERSAVTPEGKKSDLYRSRVIEAHLDVSDGAEEARWVANAELEARLAAIEGSLGADPPTA